MAIIREITYFNSFVVKKVVKDKIDEDGNILGGASTWPSMPWNPVGYPTFPLLVYSAHRYYSWYVEENRIRGGFNNVQSELGVRAYIKETTDSELILGNGLIYSGLYNSTTGFNDTNVFSVAETITKQVDPRYGAIQKLYTSDTNLIIFQTDKISNVLVDKDAIYTADGNPALTASTLVLGQIKQYAGEYGISVNPQSFSFKGNRLYFTDKDRGAVMRLSLDGLTEISTYGMRDYFRDKLASISNTPRFSNLTNVLLEYYNKSNQVVFPTDTFIARDTTTGLSSDLELGAQSTKTIEGNSGVYIVNKQITGGLTGSLAITDNSTTLGIGTTTHTVTSSRSTASQVSATVTVTVNPAFKVSSIVVATPGDLYSVGDVLTIPSIGDVTFSIATDNIIPDATAHRITFNRTLVYNNIFAPALSNEFVFYILSQDKIVGGYDNYYDNYVLSMQKSVEKTYDTLSFSEKVNGWTSFWDYKPSFIGTLSNVYYSVEGINVWKHYNESVINNRGYFYGTYYPTSVEFSFNPSVSNSKNFNTINYEGTNGWQVNHFLSDSTGATKSSYGVNSYKDDSALVYSYDEGVYVDGGVTYRVGFDRKENKYVANLINNGVVTSTTNTLVPAGQPGQVLPGTSMSGIKGYFATVKLSTDATTEIGGLKSLFAVSSNFVKS